MKKEKDSSEKESKKLSKRQTKKIEKNEKEKAKRKQFDEMAFWATAFDDEDDF